MLRTLCLDSSWRDFTFCSPLNLNFTLFPTGLALEWLFTKWLWLEPFIYYFLAWKVFLELQGSVITAWIVPYTTDTIGCIYWREQLLSPSLPPNNNQPKFPLLQSWRLCLGKCVWVVLLLDTLSASQDVDFCYSVFGIKYLTCRIFGTFPVFLWHCGSDSKLGPVHDWCLYYFVDILLKTAECMTLFIVYYFCLTLKRNKRCFACFC